MASKTKSVASRIELEIEKSREESNWLKVIELAEQLKEKSRDYGIFKQFIKTVHLKVMMLLQNAWRTF